MVLSGVIMGIAWFIEGINWVVSAIHTYSIECIKSIYYTFIHLLMLYLGDLRVLRGLLGV